MTKSRKPIGVTAAAIVLAGALAVAGCGGSSTKATTAAPATATTQPATGASTTTGPGTTGSTPKSQTGTASNASVTQTIQVAADPTGKLEFTQTTLAAKAGTIKFVLRNDSTVSHNLAIQGNGVTAGPTATVAGGQTADLVATLKAGTYEFYCAVPGHREAGMQGTLTVT